MELLVLAPLSGIISIVLALYLFHVVCSNDCGDSRQREVAEAIKQGSMAFLKRQYTTLAVVTLGVAASLLVLLGWNMAMTYLVGSGCSALAGVLGMMVAVRANVRTTNAAREGLHAAFPIAFHGGAVMGLLLVGFAILGVSTLYYFLNDPKLVLGFSFGASMISLFAKAGGGIYTKTADIGADLVGKVEAGIPEDDPRNPAVIADNVGDNVGDVAGMGADIFDSYVASLVSAMVLGLAAHGKRGVLLPLELASVGIVSATVGVLSVRVKKGGDPGKALNRGTYLTCILFGVLSFCLLSWQGFSLNLFWATLVGLAAGMVIGLTSDYFTSINRLPVKAVAVASVSGPAMTILTGFSYGLISAVPSVLGICTAIVIAWFLDGIYGIAMAAVGMLSITGLVVASDAYGPIVDNAKGIAEQVGFRDEVIRSLDMLDAAGNTTKAMTKGFAIGAASLTVLSLFASYGEIVGIDVIDFMKPHVIAGAFAGAIVPPLFSAMLILGVERNAFKMIHEVRRQFREIPGLLEGKAKPDYARCVDIATNGALRELVPASIIAIMITLLTGLFLGREALGGYLAGSILTGVVFALFMASAGGAWDNSKKYIEDGYLGGKYSETHKSAVIGDTVGDPFKDTAGPSINTLLTVISLLASIFSPVIIQFALLK